MVKNQIAVPRKNLQCDRRQKLKRPSALKITADGYQMRFDRSLIKKKIHFKYFLLRRCLFRNIAKPFLGRNSKLLNMPMFCKWTVEIKMRGWRHYAILGKEYICTLKFVEVSSKGIMPREKYCCVWTEVIVGYWYFRY